MPFDAIPCPSAYVVDGDSLRCGSVRVRLFGIDLPHQTWGYFKSEINSVAVFSA